MSQSGGAFDNDRVCNNNTIPWIPLGRLGSNQRSFEIFFELPEDFLRDFSSATENAVCQGWKIYHVQET